MHINNLPAMARYTNFYIIICHLYEKTAITAEISAIIGCAGTCFTAKLLEDSYQVTLEKS